MANVNTVTFETGDFSACATTAGSPSITTTTVYDGTYAAEINRTNATQNFEIRQSGTTYYNLGTVWYLFYFLYTRLPSSGDSAVVNFQDTASTFKCGIHITSAGKFAYYDSTGTLFLNSPIQLNGGTWYAIRAKIGTGASSTFEVWINATNDVSSGGINVGTVQNGSIKFGGNNNYSDHLFFDDIYIDNATYPALVNGNTFYPQLYAQHEFPSASFINNRQQYWRCFPSVSEALVPLIDTTVQSQFSWPAQQETGEGLFVKARQRTALLFGGERGTSQQLLTPLDLSAQGQFGWEAQVPDMRGKRQDLWALLAERSQSQVLQTTLDITTQAQLSWTGSAEAPLRQRRTPLHLNEIRHTAQGPFLDPSFLPAPINPNPAYSGISGSIAAGTYYVMTTYTSELGETNQPQAPKSITTPGTGNISVTSPAATPGATGFKVYVGTASNGPFYFQGSSPIGTPLVMLSLTLSGATLPATNSAAIGSNWNISPSSWIAPVAERPLPFRSVRAPADLFFGAVTQPQVALPPATPVVIEPIMARRPSLAPAPFQSQWLDPLAGAVSGTGTATSWQIGLQDQTVIRPRRPIDSSQSPSTLVPTTSLPFIDLTVSPALPSPNRNLLYTATQRTPLSIDSAVITNTGNPLFVTILPMAPQVPGRFTQQARSAIGDLPLPADKQPINQIAWNVQIHIPLRKNQPVQPGMAHTIATLDFVFGWHAGTQERLLTGQVRRLPSDQPGYIASSFPTDASPVLSWHTQVQVPQFRRPFLYSDTLLPPTITQGGTSVVIVGPPFYVAAAAIYVAGGWQGDVREE